MYSSDGTEHSIHSGYWGGGAAGFSVDLKDNVVLYMYPHRNTISFKIVHPEINNKNVRPEIVYFSEWHMSVF